MSAETPTDPRLREVLAKLQSILVRDETLEAWAVQRRLFALIHRRVIVAATSNRLIALERGPIGGFEYTDFRSQDLKDAHVSVGIFGASIQTIFGGNITIYTELCEKARADAYVLMLQHAGQLGANAVIGVRYDANEVTSGVTEVLAYGTAVVVQPNPT